MYYGQNKLQHTEKQYMLIQKPLYCRSILKYIYLDPVYRNTHVDLFVDRFSAAQTATSKTWWTFVIRSAEHSTKRAAPIFFAKFFPSFSEIYLEIILIIQKKYMKNIQTALLFYIYAWVAVIPPISLRSLIQACIGKTLYSYILNYMSKL